MEPVEVVGIAWWWWWWKGIHGSYRGTFIYRISVEEERMEDEDLIFRF